MKPASALLALLLAASALALVPATQAEQPPCLDVYGGGCGGPAYCAPKDIRSTDLVSFLGPSVEVRIGGSCNVTVIEDGTRCPALMESAPDQHLVVGAENVWYDGCTLPLECACDPILAPMSAPAAVPCESPMPGGCGCPPTLSSSAMPCRTLQCPETDTPLPPALPPIVDATWAIATPIPSADAQTHHDCTAGLTATYACPSGFWTTRAQATEGPLSVDSTECVPMCACMPIEAAASSPIGPPCPGMGGCCGIEPPEGCGGGPNPPSCPTASVDTAALKPVGPVDPSLDGVAVATTGCAAAVTEHDGFVACPHNWTHAGSDTLAGPATVHSEYCHPVLEMGSASAAAIQPPVGVDFVDCVRGPCPPQVWCNERSADESGLVNYHLEHDCHLTISQDPVACEAWHYEETTIATVTLRKQHCDPGVPEGAPASTCCCTCDPLPIQPIVAAIDPPDDCDLRQATPAAGPSVGPIAPIALRNAVWGSDPDDCTIDGPAPPYDCVGAWGFDRHVDVGPVALTIRVCTGGPFPPPAVQALLDELAHSITT